MQKKIDKNPSRHFGAKIQVTEENGLYYIERLSKFGTVTIMAGPLNDLPTVEKWLTAFNYGLSF